MTSPRFTRQRLFSMLALVALLTVAVGPSPAAQNQTDQKKRRVAELNVALDEIERKLEALKTEKGHLEGERMRLLTELAGQEAEQAFLNSPPYVVVRVEGDQSVVILLNGLEKRLWLDGIHIKLGYSEQARGFLKEQLKGGLIYLRCVADPCARGYVFVDKNRPSLNVQLVRLGWAMALEHAPFDVKADNSQPGIVQVTGETSGSNDGAPTTGSATTAGKDVHVRGYYRKDGTYVRPHTRSAPQRKP